MSSLVFRAQNFGRKFTLAGGAVPKGGEKAASAFYTAIGKPGPQIKAAVQNAGGQVLDIFGVAAGSSALGKLGAEAAAALGPAGPLVALAGTYLFEQLFAAFFKNPPVPPADKEILSKNHWALVGDVRSWLINYTRQFGWLEGTRYAGEVLASAGWWLGPGVIETLGTQGAPELWQSQQGNYVLAFSGGSGHAIAADRVRNLRPDMYRPWMASEDWVADLASGNAYRHAVDAVTANVIRGAPRARAQWVVEEIACSKVTVKHGGGPGGSHQIKKPTECPQAFPGLFPWPHPFVKWDLSKIPPTNHALRKKVIELAGSGFSPWQVAKMDFVPWTQPHHTTSGLKSGADWVPGVSGSYDGPPRFLNAMRAPWEHGQGGGRVEHSAAYTKRARRFGPVCPVWNGPGVGALMKSPTTTGTGEEKSFFPIEAAMPGLLSAWESYNAFKAPTPGGLPEIGPGGAAAAVAAITYFILGG